MNMRTAGHPLEGTEQVYLPPGKKARPKASTAPIRTDEVARFGDLVIVEDVYENWNGVAGLTIAYVYVPCTGYRTHLSLREMGMAG